MTETTAHDSYELPTYRAYRPYFGYSRPDTAAVSEPPLLLLPTPSEISARR